MRYKNKLHYTLKYLILALPILSLLLLNFVKDIELFNELSAYLSDFMTVFEALSINRWYLDFVQLLGVFDFMATNAYSSIMINYPLYVFWVYLFDLILDIMTFVPKFIHDLGKKEK